MRTLLAGILLTVGLGCGWAGAGEPPGGAQQWPLWDGQESVADYARRTGLEPTKTLDLGNGIKLELVLIPAGKFIMGTPGQESLWIGGGIVLVAVLVLVALARQVVVRSIRRRERLQFSLRWLLLVVFLLGLGQYGGFRWWQAQQAQARKNRFDGERPPHKVTISKPFYLGKFEVTQEQYERVIGTNPSLFRGASLPVEQVTWDEAQVFCKRASAMGRTLVRLPSEAEWEYACRAGTRTDYHSGDAEADLDWVAWYYRNSGDKTHPVGTKNANAWGLCDMHGNVWEWCEDDWHEMYHRAPEDGRAWVDQHHRDFRRVVRGGSWGIDPWYCRSATRFSSYSGTRDFYFGFRLVLDAE